MTIGSKEHYEILEHFEKNFAYQRLDREKNKELWRAGQVYENGETNALYKAYISGYGLGKTNGITDSVAALMIKEMEAE